MKLCEHIILVYQNEIANGNEPVLVDVPSPDDSYAKAKIWVTFKNPLKHYDLDDVVEETFVDRWYPFERYYRCVKCYCYVSGPLEENQTTGRYERSKFDQPSTEVVATKENIYIKEGFYKKGIIPIDEWK